jgi:acetoacetyl-CoA synthetase
LVQYQRWLEKEKGLVTRDYAQLWQWSVEDLDRFWQSVWSFFDVQADGSREPGVGPSAPCRGPNGSPMPG